MIQWYMNYAVVIFRFFPRDISQLIVSGLWLGLLDVENSQSCSHKCRKKCTMVVNNCKFMAKRQVSN